MKKTISIMLALFMLLSCTAFAQSEIVLTADYKYVSEKNGYVVFGETTDTRSNDKITVEAMLDGNVFDTVVVSTVSTDGKMTFETDTIPISSTQPSGEVSFKVYSAHAKNTVTINKNELYYGVGDLHSILKNIENALKSKDFDEFKNIVVTNEDKLGVEGALLNTFDGDAKKVAQNVAFNISLNIPDNITDAGNSQKVLNEIINFRNGFSRVTLFGEFAKASNTTEFETWYNKYKDVLDLKNYNEAFFDAYFKNIYTKDVYFEILTGETRIITEETVLKDRLIEVGALYVVKNGNANNVNKVFTDFSGKIPTTVTSQNVFYVYGQLAENKFTDFTKLGNKYDEIARTQNVTVPVSPGGGGFGGGSSSGGSGSGNSSDFTIGLPQTKTDDVFKDVTSSHWAYKAVNALYEKGIVSGKGVQAFMPEDYVTRAEFLKMLVLAGKLDIVKAQQNFVDVKENDWFFDYVNTACALNIVTGDDLGKFNPNEKITRQDMAVMICRMLGKTNEKGDLSAFSDSDTISEYAKTSVGVLSGMGIVNGMGDGTFAPFSNATRAQASQMIYNILNFVK